MNNKFKSLYADILKELWNELSHAEALYFEISQTLLKYLNDGVLSPRLADLEKRFRQKLSGIISDLGTVYSGRIELFPVPENSGMLQRMEIFNRQFEELERILKNMFLLKNIELPENNMEKQWNQLIKQIEKNTAFFKPNILVCGQHAIGKTSLIQAVTLQGTVNDDAIGYRQAVQNRFTRYETPIADFIDDPDDAGRDIHHIWYCIDGSGAQLSQHDTELIRKFSCKLLLVVTKCDLMNKEQTGMVMDQLSSLICRDRIIMVSAESKTGLPKLVLQTQAMIAEALNADDKTSETFRERWKNYYSDMLQNWTDIANDEADNCISWTENQTIPPSTADMTYMIYKLAAIYGSAIENTVIARLMARASGIGKAAKAYFASDMELL